MIIYYGSVLRTPVSADSNQPTQLEWILINSNFVVIFNHNQSMAKLLNEIGKQFVAIPISLIDQ